MSRFDEVLASVREIVDMIPISQLDQVPDVDRLEDRAVALAGRKNADGSVEDSDAVVTALGRLLVVALIADRAEVKHLRAVRDED